MILKLIRGAVLAAALLGPSGAAGADHLHVVRHHVPVVVQAAATVTYDTSIGLGVDTTGRSTLSLRSGASRYYVNSSTGSDTNTCTQATAPATPKATIESALNNCVTSGNGDQVLVAQGTSYTNGLNTAAKSGFSAQYPTVIESYDPADPTNEAKLGIAGTLGRPIINTGGTVQNFLQGTGPNNYIAVRGFDFEPGQVALNELKMVAPASGSANYFLFENNIFHYTALDYNGSFNTTTKSLKWIVRNNAFYDSFGDHSQGIYLSSVDGATIEDNIFWHSGWKPVGSSGFTASISGETMTVSAASGGSIVAGQLVTGAGVAPGTFVSAFGTGTGGTGTYTVGVYQNVRGTTAMTGGTVGSSSFTATVAQRTLTVKSISSGSIAVGQVITGSGLVAGTTIISQQSGTTGGVGTYTIDVPQTVSSEAMTGSEDRTMPASLNGPSQFNHAIYAQDNDVNMVVRRSAFVDTATDGGNLKGGGDYQGNLSIRNPNAFAMGAGDIFGIDAPLGDYMDAGYNAVIGSNLVTDSGASGWGIRSSDNGRPSSLFHGNVIVRNDQVTTNGAFQINQGADNNGTTLPDFGTFDHNVAYLWSTSGTSVINTGGATVTLTNNIWDDPTSGTNTNNGSVSFANAYTETSLLAALPGAYASEAAAVADWVAHPEQHGWENAAPLMLAGYGVTKAQQDLTTDMRITAGLATSGQFIGTLDGYSLTATGLPACMTLDDSSKAWRTDTSCTASSGTASITESNGTLSHVSSIPWTIYNAPVLSGVSVTPGTTTATINVSTTVGSGNLYAIVDPTTTATIWPAIRAGMINTNDTGTAAVAKASAAVTASGAQPGISVSGLTSGTAYMLQIVPLDANNNPGAVATYNFTTN